MIIMVLACFTGLMQSAEPHKEHVVTSIDLLEKFFENEKYSEAYKYCLTINKLGNAREVITSYQLLVDAQKEKEKLEQQEKKNIQDLLTILKKTLNLTPQEIGGLLRNSLKQIADLNLLKVKPLPKVIHWNYPENCDKKIFNIIGVLQIKMIMDQRKPLYLGKLIEQLEKFNMNFIQE